MNRCRLRAQQLRLIAAAFFPFLLAASTGWGAEDAPLHSRIDALLRESRPAAASERCTDADFLRRVSLDLVGSIPPPQEARQFLSNSSNGKRSALVDRLLSSSRYAIHLAHVFDVWLLERRDSTAIKHDDWDRYLYESFLENKPYSQLAHEILAADGANPKTRPAVKFYLERNGDPNLLTRDVARIFFARDLQCCQCHDHPLVEQYKQADYYGLYAFLQRGFVTIDTTKPENKDKPVYFGETADGRIANFTSVFDKKKERHSTRPRLPGDVEIDEPYYPPGDEYQPAAAGAAYPAPKYSRRARLADETIATHNRAFRRNIVNRLWAHMMGQGLFEPLDLDHADNPPANPRLLEMLADEFQAGGYNIKEFLREIALTDAYQRSFEVPAHAIAAEAPAASALLPDLESQEKQLAAQSPGMEAEIKRLNQQLAQQKRASLPMADALVQAENKAAESKKSADAASEAMRKSRSDLADRQATIQVLADAALKVQRVAVILPKETELASAGSVFRKRAETMRAELPKGMAAVAAQEAAARKAAKLLEAAQVAAASAEARFAAVDAQSKPIKRAIREATNRYQAHVARLNSLKQSVTRMKAAGKFAARFAEASRAEKLLHKTEAEQSAFRRIAEIRRHLFAAREGQLMSATSGETEDASSLQSGRAAAAFEQAKTELAASNAQLAKLDSRVRTERERAKAARAAADAELKAVTQYWTRDFSVAALKPLTPEQLGENLLQALGVKGGIHRASEAELRKKEPAIFAKDPAAANRLLEREVDRQLRGPLQRFIGLFGGGPGQPQRDFFATVDQALFFSNGGELQSWLAPTGGHLTERLLKIGDPRARDEELYLAVLTRFPTGDERAEVDTYLAGRTKDRAVAMQEVVWALVTSSEFRFSH